MKNEHCFRNMKGKYQNKGESDNVATTGFVLPNILRELLYQRFKNIYEYGKRLNEI